MASDGPRFVGADLGSIRCVAHGDFQLQPMFYSPQLADVQNRLTDIEAAILGLGEITAAVLDAVNAVDLQGEELMADLSALDAAVSSMESTVSENTDAVASASSLLDQLAQMIRDNATDPAALAALADRISSSASAESTNNAALAAAVAANTPAAPATPATPADGGDTPPA